MKSLGPLLVQKKNFKMFYIPQICELSKESNFATWEFLNFYMCQSVKIQIFWYPTLALSTFQGVETLKFPPADVVLLQGAKLSVLFT